MGRTFEFYDLKKCQKWTHPSNSPFTRLWPFSVVQKIKAEGLASMRQFSVTSCPRYAPIIFWVTLTVGGTAQGKRMSTGKSNSYQFTRSVWCTYTRRWVGTSLRLLDQHHWPRCTRRNLSDFDARFPTWVFLQSTLWLEKIKKKLG